LPGGAIKGVGEKLAPFLKRTRGVQDPLVGPPRFFLPKTPGCVHPGGIKRGRLSGETPRRKIPPRGLSPATKRGFDGGGVVTPRGVCGAPNKNGGRCCSPPPSRGEGRFSFILSPFSPHRRSRGGGPAPPPNGPPTNLAGEGRRVF